MGKIDPIWFAVFSDWLINLSAGWFGAAFIVSAFSNLPRRINFLLLTFDFCLSIISLVLAFKFRKLAGL